MSSYPFSIREFVLKVREVDPAACWPFGGDPVEGAARLPPMRVQKFRWWKDEEERAEKEGEEEEERVKEGELKGSKRRKTGKTVVFREDGEGASGGSGEMNNMSGLGKPEVENVALETKKEGTKKKRGRKKKIAENEISVDRQSGALDVIMKAFNEVRSTAFENVGPKKGSKWLCDKLRMQLQNSFQPSWKKPLAIQDSGIQGILNPLIQHGLHPLFLPLFHVEGFKSVLCSGQFNGSVSLSGSDSQDARSQQSFEVGESSNQSLNPRVTFKSLKEDAPAKDRSMCRIFLRSHQATKKEDAPAKDRSMCRIFLRSHQATKKRKFL